MREISRLVFCLLFLFIFSTCAIFYNAESRRDYFIVDQARLVEFTKEALRENNLRIYSEMVREDGIYEIIAFLPPEGREYPSEVTDINSLRVFLTPDVEGGFYVSVQQPPEQEMPRAVAHIDYKDRLLHALNELINPEEVEF